MATTPSTPSRADLLRRVGRNAESRVAFDRAIELSDNAAEIAFLTRRRDPAAGRMTSSTLLPGARAA